MGYRIGLGNFLWEKRLGWRILYSHTRRNAQAQREVLENLQRCPDCGSRNYEEEIVGKD